MRERKEAVAQRINRDVVKRYFVGKKQTLPIILMLVGVVTIAVIVGIFLLIAGLIWFLYNKFSADLSGESEVDRAVQHEINNAKIRAMRKLNIVDEQVQDVAPVVVSGRGTEPETTALRKNIGVLAKLGKVFKLKGFKKKKDEIEEDPEYRVRIGSDNKFRCSLLSISVFLFGQSQLYIYYCDIDLCTGLVYREGTHEYFYCDINAISFAQEKEKIYNFKKKKYQRVLFECVKIFASGCHHTAALAADGDRSVIDQEFAGMRTLIRERKNMR